MIPRRQCDSQTAPLTGYMMHAEHGNIFFKKHPIYYLPVLSGVIIFGSDQEVAELMKAVKRLGATGKFSWIGSDGWSARALVSDGIITKNT